MSDLPIASAAVLTGTTLASNDVLPVLDVSASAGSKGSQITVAELFAGRSLAATAALGLRNAGTGAFDLTLAHNGTLTAGRTLTWNVNDAARAVNLAGNLTLTADFTTAGANALTLTTTGATNITLPISGTLAVLDANTFTDVQTISNTLAGSAATSALVVSPTWNTTGSPAAIYSRITNTASGSGSKLIDLGTVAGGSLFSVDMNGYVNAAAGGYTTASLRMGGANTGLSALGGARLDVIVSGSQLATFDVSGFNVYAVRTSSAKYGFNPFGSSGPTISSGSGSPEGVASAEVGSIYLRSDGGASTSFYVKESGTGNTGWEAK